MLNALFFLTFGYFKVKYYSVRFFKTDKQLVFMVIFYINCFCFIFFQQGFPKFLLFEFYIKLMKKTITNENCIYYIATFFYKKLTRLFTFFFYFIDLHHRIITSYYFFLTNAIVHYSSCYF